MRQHTSTFRVPVAFCAIGLFALVFIGCEKASPTAELPRESPESYMNDPVFRKAVARARVEREQLAAARKPLVDRMRALSKQYGDDPGKLQNVPEWVELRKKVAALTARYEDARQRQLALVRDRLSPAKKPNTISK